MEVPKVMSDEYLCCVDRSWSLFGFNVLALLDYPGVKVGVMVADYGMLLSTITP